MSPWPSFARGVRRYGWTACLALGLARAAAAPPDPAEFIAQYFDDLGLVGTTDKDAGVARFGFTDAATRIDAPFEKPSYADAYMEARNVVEAWSADKKVAWVSADLPQLGAAMGSAQPSIMSWSHAAAVIVPSGKGWHGVAFLARRTIDDGDQAAVLKNGTVPPAFARRIDAGAEPVAKQFEATIVDPAAFAASVSDRADVVLFGSSRADRVVGGAKVAAALKKWNLKLAVRDGVQAGLVGKTVAWVAANVDAVAAGGKPGTPTPYQLLAIYENAGGSWRLVQASFAFFRGTGG